MVDLTSRIIGAESGGNPLARNPRSSAGGSGQFLDKTWLGTLKKHRPDLAAGKSDAELLRLKFDPTISREMTSAYASDNQNFLGSRGIEATPGNTYLAHFAGPAGAAALHANPQATVEATLGPRVVAANPFLRGKTGADVINWASGKMDPAKAMAANLRQRFGANTEGGVTPQAQQVSGGEGIDRLKSALTKSYDPDRLTDAESLTASGQRIAGTSGNALGVIGGSILAGIGGYQRNQERDARKAHDAEFSRLAGDASNTEGLMNVMLGSSDPAMRSAGLEMKAKLLAPQQPVEINGRLVQKQADGSYKEVYASPPKPQGPMEVGGRIVQQQPDGSFKEVYSAPPKPSAPVITEVYDSEGRKQKAIVQPDTGEFKPIGGTAAADAAAKLGLHPQTYVDKDGNLVYTQLSEMGGRKDVELPEGARWAPGFDIKDTGTSLTGFNKKTGEVGNVVPKDVAGKEAAEERGKLAGQAQVALPASKSTLDNAFKTIGDLRKHPGLETGTGGSNVFDPRSWIPGTNAYDFIAKNKQAQGQSFMAARDALKGAGQVTDFEGTKGEQAIANLDAAQSKDQYLEALDTLEKMMRTSYEDMQKKAGMAAAGQPAASGGERARIDLNNGQPHQPKSEAEFQALPSGTRFIDPDGKVRIKP